jgi:AcrR family transcriptional regulator
VSVKARLSPDARRAQLLELGVRIFSERPYDELSMDRIAELAGVSKGLLYHYFPTKRAFYVASLSEIAEGIAGIISSGPRVRTGRHLREGILAFLGFVQDHRVIFQAVRGAGIGSDPEVAAVADRVRDAAYSVIVETAPGLPQMSPRLRVAIRGWIGLVEAASLEWAERPGMERGDLVELLVQALASLVQAAHEQTAAIGG